MVQNRIKARFSFWVFVLPALALYMVFAIYPLCRGLWLSTTNWDGTAPWVPAQLEIPYFEGNILSNIHSDRDRKLVLKYYLKDEDQGTYRKLEVYGHDRDRLMSIFSSAGYINPDMKSVGLQNYIDIFTGKIDARFFPERYKAGRFNVGTPLLDAASIQAVEFEKYLLAHLDKNGRSYLSERYIRDGDVYRLTDRLSSPNELDQQILLSSISALEEDWEDLYQSASRLGEEGRTGEAAAWIGAALLPYETAGGSASGRAVLSSEERASAVAVLDVAIEYGRIKSLLANGWYHEEMKLGVLLFTLFFVFFFVIGVNVLGLLLALALDTRIRSRNILRAVFYLPNVLSMIIVAFIWQLMFTQLIPSITGIRQLMNNPALAPWITVCVAVWQGVGYYTIIYIAGLQSVPQDILESAALDGARGWSRFRRIVLPMLVPAITICLFLSISGSLKTFDIIFALYPGTSTPLGIDNITVNIFYDAFRDKHAGLATAKAVLLMIVIVVLTGIQLFITKKKEVEL